VCGRYTLTAPGELVEELFGVEAGPELRARYNIAPTQPAPIVRRRGQRRRMDLVEWGLVPSWARDAAANRSINARAESILEKPSFRDSFAERRCLVPADGFYEWKSEGPRLKTPHHLRPTHGGVIAFAGLWDARRDDADRERLRETFAIITTDASPDLRFLHDRMPVVVPPDSWASWLDPASDATALQTLLGPAPEGFFEPRAVGPRVNSVENDDASLLEDATGPRQLSLI
jgi:putative SOS response-associated peptidase YedK